MEGEENENSLKICLDIFLFYLPVKFAWLKTGGTTFLEVFRTFFMVQFDRWVDVNHEKIDFAIQNSRIHDDQYFMMGSMRPMRTRRK